MLPCLAASLASSCALSRLGQLQILTATTLRPTTFPGPVSNVNTTETCKVLLVML